VEMVDAGGRGQENVEMRGCWMEERAVGWDAMGLEERAVGE